MSKTISHLFLVQMYIQTNDNEFAFRIGLYEFNFLRRTMTFGGFYQDDIYSSYGINFRAPFLFSRHLGVAFNFQNLTTLEPVFLNNGTADYRYNNTSYELLSLIQFDYKNRIELGGAFFTEDYLYQRGATNENVPQSLSVDKFLFKGVYEFTNLNYNYQYINGFRSIFNAQYVISANEVLPQFVIAWNDFLFYKRIRSKG